MRLRGGWADQTAVRGGEHLVLRRLKTISKQHRRLTMKLRLALFLSLTACLAVAVSPAIAGKVTPSITLNEAVTGASATPSGPSLGSYVTFTTVVPTNVRNPRVEVLCYQNGELVYGEAGGPSDAFLLGGNPDRGSIWRTTGGPASCVANLYFFTWKAGEPGVTYLATTSFDAAG
jgi:hypothetical protein